MGLRRIMKYLIFILTIGIVIGFILQRFFIIPGFFISSDSKMKMELSYQHIIPRKYYVVQCGVFSYRKNAQSLVNTINAASLPVFMYQDGDYYRVILHTGINYEALNNKVLQYKSTGLDYIIKEIYVNAKEVPENHKNDNRYIVLSNIINNMGEAVDCIIEEIAKYEDKELDNYAFSLNVKSMYEKIDDTMGLFNLITEEDGILKAQLEEDCGYIKSVINEISETTYDISGLEEKKFWCIQRYKNFVEHFNNSIY